MTMTHALKHIGLIFCAGLLSTSSLAQNEQDALNLSREEVTGSARTVAMGGAFTALGGDISAIHWNPAAAGVFRTNEFSISSAFHTHVSSTEYYGSSTLDSKSNFNFATLGIVGTKDIRQRGKWRSQSFAFGMNRAMSFHRSFSANADRVQNSIIDDYINILDANDITPDDFAEGPIPYPFDIFLAWENFLIDTLPQVDGYYNATGELPVAQDYQFEQSGAKRNTFFTYGANYDDKLYLGASATISRIIYERIYSLSESTDPNDSTTVLNEHTYSFQEEIDGYGISASLGAIYRPIPALRLGLSIFTPTLYSLSTEYESNSTAIFLGNQIFETPSPTIGTYDFSLSTPFRSNFGVAYVFGKWGLISADIEYVDYNSMRMEGISDGYAFGPEEQAIRTELLKTFNYRLGGELRLTPFTSLRAGFAHYSNPYTQQLNLNGSFNLYSAGVGYRNETFFLDASYQLKQSAMRSFLYDPNLVNPYYASMTDHRVTVTFGYRF
jgi:hypothetical protein